MQLTEYHEGALRYGYKVAGAEGYQYSTTKFGSDDAWRIYKVTISFAHDEGKDYQTVGNTQYTDAQMIAALNPAGAVKHFDLKVSRTNNKSLCMFFTADSTTTAVASGSSADLVLTAPTTGDVYSNSMVYYFGMYLDGVNHDEALTGENVQTGNFTVTLSASK